MAGPQLPHIKKRKLQSPSSDESTAEIASNNLGVASTLAYLQGQEPNHQSAHTREAAKSQSSKRRKSNDGTARDVSAVQDRKNKSNYPGLSYSELHRLHSSIKIGDLQSLVLYCLADGVSPQWLSLRHHAQVRRAVVLLVPGLEIGMFNGHIQLTDRADGDDGTRCQADSSNGSDVDASIQEDSLLNLQSQNAEPTVTSQGVNGRSPDDYMPVSLVGDTLPAPLKPLANIFNHVWPVQAPGDDKYYKVHSPLHAMLTTPLPKSKEEKKEEKAAKGAKPAREGKCWENQPTPITAFLASDEDLRENEYNLHPVYFVSPQEAERENIRRKQIKESSDDGWKDSIVTKLEDGTVPGQDIQKGSLTAGRQILAMDCEMCKTEGGDMDLTRISVVGWDGEVVMDELVKPEKRIIDYLTPYSGITSAALGPITTTLSDIQARLLDLLTPQTILIGHSLNADLAALKITHPFIIDTSLLYPHPRGPPLKSSLKWLSQKYLSREIQKGHGTMGHNSIEDATACLDLVKQKCEKGSRWGTSEAVSESIFRRLARSPRTSSPISEGKIGIIIDYGAPERNFGSMAKACISCTSDAEVVDAVRRAVQGDSDGKVVPGGGVDFTWARMRELEAFRGWWNNNRSSPPVPAHANDTPNSNPNHSAFISSPSPSDLSTVVSQTVQHIAAIHALLPPCTLFIIYSGTGDPLQMSRLQAQHRRFKDEYKVKKWDELSVRWTDTEEQALRRACRDARKGIGFVCVK